MTNRRHFEGDILENNSDPMPLDASNQRRSGDHHRSWFRFDPTVSTGTMLQIASIMVGFALAYGTYREDQTRMKADIEAVRVSGERDRTELRQQMSELRLDVKDVKSDVGQITRSVVVLEAQGKVQAARRP